MIFSRLEASVKADEGLKLSPYLDIEKVWTIGYGSTFIGGAPVTEKTLPISEAFALQLLRAELFDSCLEAQRFFPDLMELTDLRQEILAEMAYQLGLDGLSQFVHFRERLTAHDWQGAANHMRASKWHDETPDRVERLATLMAAG